MTVVENLWMVRPSGDGQDLISFMGSTVGSIMWVRELRYPSICRLRIAQGLDGYRSPSSRVAWTARPFAASDSVWLISHNGVEIGELRWFDGVLDRSAEGVLAGLNMLAGGRRPFACEPMPVTRPHLTVVR